MSGRIRATRTEVDGHMFASKREANRYLELKLLERAKKIIGLTLQVRIQISIRDVPILMRSARYPNGRHLTYVADFMYYDATTHKKVVEDCKGHRTDVYKLKLALVQAMGLEILET